TRNMGQHLCHKATAEIFKCQRWPVEQFQTTDIAFNIGDRSREGKRRAHALFQDFLRDFITNKRREEIPQEILEERVRAATKSSFSISSISVRLNSGRSCGKNSP